MTLDPKPRHKALSYLSAYLRYKNWYVRFLYEFQGDTVVGLLGILAGSRQFFEKLGGVDDEFFQQQDQVRAEAKSILNIPDDKKADELMAYVLGHFDWVMLEYYDKTDKTCGLILGKKDFIDETDKATREPEDEKTAEKEAPKAVRPKPKEEQFVNEKGQLLYWN